MIMYRTSLSAPSAPTILKTTPSNVNENVGVSDIRLRCTVTGSPRPKVTWFKGDQVIGTCMGLQNGSCNAIDNKEHRLLWEDKRSCKRRDAALHSTLVIKRPVYPDDAGKYSCRAKNQRGESISRSAIVVLNGEYMLMNRSFHVLGEALVYHCHTECYNMSRHVLLAIQASEVGIIIDRNYCGERPYLGEILLWSVSRSSSFHEVILLPETSSQYFYLKVNLGLSVSLCIKFHDSILQSSVTTTHEREGLLNEMTNTYLT